MKTPQTTLSSDPVSPSSLHAATALAIRAGIATVMFPHGAQIMIGAFGGGGFSDTMNYFVNVAGLPWVIGLLVILIQFFGSIFILLGFFSRLNGLGMLVITVGMIFSGHTEHGFFMNWYGNQQGEGFEFHLLLLALCAALVAHGGGKYSIDQLIQNLKHRRS